MCSITNSSDFLVQVISGIVRYMRHGHRQDFIDACLSAIAEEKLPQIAALLDRRHKATTQILGALGRGGLSTVTVSPFDGYGKVVPHA